MKKLSLTASAVFALFLMACNNQSKTEQVAADPAPVVAPAAEAAPVFAPYKAMLAVQTVQDFDKWNKAFVADEATRVGAGMTDPGVGRGIENDKQAIVMVRTADAAKAKEMVSSPALKESMKKAGVTGVPTIAFLDVIYDDTTTIPQQERLMVTHHVKDFAAWKKAFDSETAASRAENGMIERAMAQSQDDPNTVTVLFAITDMAKAKARVASPDLKKLMTEAGVDKAPTLTWFKWVKA